MTEAYPLAWPAGRPRTACPSTSKFGARSIDSATQTLMRELRLLGADSIVLSSNLRVRNDGLPYSKQASPADKGVAVYFQYKKRQMCFACDRWDRMQDNIYAVAMTIEALRGIERWGSGDMVQQAFTGFEALPPPIDCWKELHIHPGSPADVIGAAYRTLAKACNGNEAVMYRLNAAKEEALRRAK